MREGENQFLSVIRIWAALAWADDVIADQEREAMRRLIDGAELSDDDRETAMSWLDNRVELDTANIKDLTERARHGIYRAAVRLAAVDQDFAAEEKSFLIRLRDGLDIDEDTASRIAATLPRE
jgi:uncharacterized membrane protein YebE (DUF533 family)